MTWAKVRHLTDQVTQVPQQISFFNNKDVYGHFITLSILC